MTYDEIVNKLNGAYEIKNTKAVGNGTQIELTNGAKINCFNNGNNNVQGKNCEEVKNFLINKVSISRKVFVVYGHDIIARTQLEAMLRRWDLEPIILDQQASGGQTVIEKLEEFGKDVSYAIVLATPDDEGKAKEEEKYKHRVRQNVVLELGMFLAKLGRNKVAILLKEDENFERPSDINGLIYIPFKDNVEDSAISLIRELNKQGFRIDSSKI
jgi:predicted nucleotide-binding protein